MGAYLMDQTEALAREIATQATTLEELHGVMKTLMSSALERMLNTELEVHLGRRMPGTVTELPASGTVSDRGTTSTKSGRNRRNGSSPKTIQGELGQLPLDIPRDREGTFEPQLVAKHQRRLPGFDEKILALYAKGMTTRDIQELLKELYGVDDDRGRPIQPRPDQHRPLAGDHRREPAGRYAPFAASRRVNGAPAISPGGRLWPLSQPRFSSRRY